MKNTPDNHHFNNSAEEQQDEDVKLSSLRSRVRKGQVQALNSSPSDKQQQLVLDDDGVDEDDDESAASDSVRFEIGDLVWGKIKSHPWWPGQIYNQAFASAEVRSGGIEGQVLVAFFGDGSYGWFYPAQLVPFEYRFSENCRQSGSRNFGKAVEEAVEEATRRSALPFVCRCRNRDGFRPSDVEGYFCVGEIGSLYSGDLIRKGRDGFQPTEMVAFLNQLAVAPTGDEDRGIGFIKSKAAVMAYRKAVYQEVDDTYAREFGHIPDVRSSLKKALGTGRSPKMPIRAPLSGPLVIAEPLGREKGLAKLNKGKVQARKDQFLFKRRDEANEVKSSVLTNPSHITSSEQPVYIEGSSAKVKDDYVLQKRSPSVSTEHMVQEKQESTEMRSENYVSDSSEVPVGEGIIMEDKFAAVKAGTIDVRVESSKAESPFKPVVDQDAGKFSHPLKARPFFNERKYGEMKNKAGLVSNVDDGLVSQSSSNMIGGMPRTFESSGVNIDVKYDHPSSSASSSSRLATSELHDGFTVAHVSGTTTAVLHGKDKNIHKLNSMSSTALENKKKKPKKELMSSQNMQMHPSDAKNGSSVTNMAGKYVCTPVASRDSQVDPKKEEDNVRNSFPPNSVATLKNSNTENIKLKLPQLLYNLKSLALDPFHHSDSSLSVIQQIVLRFRSLVFQKSLAPLPPASWESKETRRSKPAAIATNNIPAENVRELKPVKTQKLVVRPDDPARGGRKHVPSDRQEEIAAKRRKILNAKPLIDQRTAEKSSLMQRGEVKETSALKMKSVKPEPVKKVQPPSRESDPDPAMLVMKFPLRGTLPSINALKARFIRFGQLDHSACRVLWKSSTCLVVFRHKVDAQAAYNYAASSTNMFGATGIKCYLREMEVAASEQKSGKVQQDEVLMSTSQLRDSTVERRYAAPPAFNNGKQSGAQVKPILKRATGDETSSSGGIRGPPRVKFMLNGEENSEGAGQLMIGNKNSTNAIFADGGTSTSHAMHSKSKNFQNITSFPLPPLPPTPTTGTHQLPQPQESNLQYTKESPKTNHNSNIPTADPMTPSTPNVDISEQMINLLTECSQVVNNLVAFLGYVPYHPL
ncbi:hypothetical protein ACET3Z_001600 [Daucus carota]